MNEDTKNIPVEINLSGNRKIDINVNMENITKNIVSLQCDVNKLFEILQEVICVDDENRVQTEQKVINISSMYLLNAQISLVDYFHMNIDDYRLATTMTMDAIIVYNKLCYIAQEYLNNTKNEDELETP